MLGPAAETAIMSSTDATMAPAAVQPSMRVLSAEPVSRAGDAAGEPVVAVVTPVSALPPPAFQSRSPNSQASGDYPKCTKTCPGAC
jgi:hypothetical protein